MLSRDCRPPRCLEGQARQGIVTRTRRRPSTASHGVGGVATAPRPRPPGPLLRVPPYESVAVSGMLGAAVSRDRHRGSGLRAVRRAGSQRELVRTSAGQADAGQADLDGAAIVVSTSGRGGGIALAGAVRARRSALETTGPLAPSSMIESENLDVG